jgi:methionine synthase I (cobalamin-dependent)
VREAAGEGVVIIAQVSVERDGTLPGSFPTAMNADAIGVNCSFGPDSVFRAIERMCGMGRLLSASPSAGVGTVCSPDDFVRHFPRVHIMGGCCGTTPEHIRQLRAALH